MKKIIAATLMLLALNAFATIEYDGDDALPSAQEVSRNRACFEEVARNGCGDPGDDVKHFRKCVRDVMPKLTQDCRKLMTFLYAPKK